MLLLQSNITTLTIPQDPFMQGKKVLIIEDDKHISKLVKYNFDKSGATATVVVTGEDALKILDKEAVDLIILDIMLPKMNGFDVCREIKSNARFASIPVIMLTARGEEVDRIVGLELGADDYMIKPFSPRELILRARAILKRGQPKKESPKEIMTIDKLTVDLPRHKVIMNNKEIILTAMEFKLLVMLMQRLGRVQTRDDLLRDVWDIQADITTRTIDTHVKRLRQKLGKMGDYIETVRGSGYRFSEPE